MLCKQHLIDLLADDTTSATDKAVLSDLKAGTIGMVYGVKTTVNERLKSQYLANGTKKALGAAAVAGDKNASIMIERNNSLFDHHTILAQVIPFTLDTKFKVPQTRIRFYGQFMGSVIHDDKERAALIDGAA